MRIKHNSGFAGSLVHDGVVYQPDEAGFFTVPFSLGASMAALPWWETEEPRPVTPAPAPEPEQAPKEPVQESEAPATRAAARAAARAAKAAADTPAN